MPELHPIGTFNDVEILDHGFDESPEKNTPFFWVSYKTEIGNLTGRFYLTDRTVEYTIQKIEAMGFNGDSLAELADGTALAGNLCQITVEHETYEGNTRARVGFVNPNNSTIGPTHNEKAAANVKQFDTMWRVQRKGGGLAGADKVPF